MTSKNIKELLLLRKKILEEAIGEMRKRWLRETQYKSRAIRRSSAANEFLRIYEIQLGEVNRTLKVIRGGKDTDYLMFGCEELYDDIKRKMTAGEKHDDTHL